MIKGIGMGQIGAAIAQGMNQGLADKREQEARETREAREKFLFDHQKGVIEGEQKAVLDRARLFVTNLDPDGIEKELNDHLVDAVDLDPEPSQTLTPLKTRDLSGIPLTPGDPSNPGDQAAAAASPAPPEKPKKGMGSLVIGGGAPQGKGRKLPAGMTPAMAAMVGAGAMTEDDATENLKSNRGRAISAATAIRGLHAQMSQLASDMELMPPEKRAAAAVRLKALNEEMEAQHKLLLHSFEQGRVNRQVDLGARAFDILATRGPQEAARFMALQPNAFDPTIIAAMRMATADGGKVFLPDGSTRSLAGFAVSSGLVGSLTAKEKMNFLMRETEHLDKMRAKELHDRLMADTRIRAVLTSKSAEAKPMQEALAIVKRIADLEQAGKAGSQEYADLHRQLQLISTLLPTSTPAGFQSKAETPGGKSNMLADRRKQLVRAVESAQKAGVASNTPQTRAAYAEAKKALADFDAKNPEAMAPSATPMPGAAPAAAAPAPQKKSTNSTGL